MFMQLDSIYTLTFPVNSTHEHQTKQNRERKQETRNKKKNMNFAVVSLQTNIWNGSFLFFYFLPYLRF